MSNIKPFYLKTNTVTTGPFVTSRQAEQIVRIIINKLSFPIDLGTYSDGKRHIGTECAKIYKHMYVTGMVKETELAYIKATNSVRESLSCYNIPANFKKLRHKSAENCFYCQVISLRILAIYISGKLGLSDMQTEYFLTSLLEDTSKGVYDITINLSNSDLVAGNKPVDIEGKPLVKVLKQLQVDQEIKETGASLKTVSPCHNTLHMSAEDSLTYVKTGPLMRKDIYIAIKAIAAKEQKPFYQVLEDIVLGKSVYSFAMFEGGDN